MFTFFMIVETMDCSILIVTLLNESDVSILIKQFPLVRDDKCNVDGKNDSP